MEKYKEMLGQMSTLPVPLVVEGGTSVHYIELSPGMTSAMHQTVSSPFRSLAWDSRRGIFGMGR